MGTTLHSMGKSYDGESGGTGWKGFSASPFADLPEERLT